jgi:dihydroorotase
MSSNSRKAPFFKTACPKGWVIYNSDHAWYCFSAEGKIKTSDSVKDILTRAKALGSWTKQIPDSWKSLSTGLDLQVHLRFPGQPQKETLEGGLESALLAGYDSLVSMPNTNPYLDSAEALGMAIQSSKDLASEYPVRIGFAASATLGMKGESAAPIDALAKAGAVAITDDGWGVKSDKAQEEIFAACAANDLLFQQHCEMPGHRGVTPAGIFQKRYDLPEYPRSAESEMIRRDLNLLRKQRGARYHVLHVSTKESLVEIERAKAEGLQVTVEVTPHHLFFSNEDIPEPVDPRCTYFKMNPPLFSPEDRDALQKALVDGLIDCVSTDHAPHEKELKQKGWLISPFGTRGMETALPVLLTLAKPLGFDLQKIEKIFSSRPREILKKFQEPTGIIFVDEEHTHEITQEDLPGISENSCFLGKTLKGRIEMRAHPELVYSR